MSSSTKRPRTSSSTSSPSSSLISTSGNTPLSLTLSSSEKDTRDITAATSLLALERIKFSTSTRKLENKIKFLLSENELLTNSLEEIRNSVESDINKVKRERDHALSEAMKVRKELLEFQSIETDVSQLANVNDRNNNIVMNLQGENKMNLKRIKELEDFIRTSSQPAALSSPKIEGVKPLMSSPFKPPSSPSRCVECTKLRVTLSTTTTTLRTLHRTSEVQAKKIADQTLALINQQKSEEKLKKLEEIVKCGRREIVETRELRAEWKVWREEILKAFGEVDDCDGNGNGNGNGNNSEQYKDFPVEVCRVLRKFEEIKCEKEAVNEKMLEGERSVERLKRSVFNAEEDNTNLQTKLTNLQTDYKNIESEHLQSSNSSRLHKLENANLLELLQTYERSETSSNPAPTGFISDKDGPTVSALRADVARLNDEVDNLESKGREDQSKYATTVEKFYKLKEALNKSKTQAQHAEDRANKAESLCGKGLYNPETTKILHLKANPLHDAIVFKYEKEISKIKELCCSLEEELVTARSNNTNSNNNSNSNNSNSSNNGSFNNSSNYDITTPSKPTPLKPTPLKPTFKTPGGGTGSSRDEIDKDILVKRLKEIFAKKIALFREGVFLLTGWKVDLIQTTESDKGKLKIRSIYAESESDYLLFRFNDGGKLELLESEYAKSVGEESMVYLKTGQSIPAFVGNLTLSLFDKQTFLG